MTVRAMAVTPKAQQKRARLGCKSCRAGDEARHPHLGRLWCAVCPIATHLASIPPDNPKET